VNASWLVGKPDIVFTNIKLAVFVDGDFWHGWEFERWGNKLALRWREKIAGNIARDRRHAVALRAQGWTVMRIWEHDVEKSLQRCIARIERKAAQLRRADQS
jgi:DNA mismatch endonuclease (patch repair protein)